MALPCLSHFPLSMRVQLHLFQQITVLSDVFFVWHDGPFGTINGLRLGRLPITQVLSPPCCRANNQEY